MSWRDGRWLDTLPAAGIATSHVKFCKWLTSYDPTANLCSRLVIGRLSCRKYSAGDKVYTSHGGGGVDVSIHLCGRLCCLCLSQTTHSDLCSG